MKAALLYLLGFVTIVVLALTRALAPEASAPAEPPSAATPPAGPSPTAPRGHVGVLVAAHATDVATTHAAIVVGVDVAVGDHVEVGAPLVRLDARAARHELTAAEVEEQQLRELSSRGAALLEVGVVSREEATQMRFAARAKAAQARRARVSVDAAILRAPFSGIVVERRVEQGMVLAPGAAAVRIISDGPARVRFGVAPSEAHGLSRGDEVWFADAADVGVPGLRARIESISDEIDRSTELVTIEAEVQGEHPLRSGARVRVFTPRDLGGPDPTEILLGRANAGPSDEE
jgi:RND family efflux transporter MFP subunit